MGTEDATIQVQCEVPTRPKEHCWCTLETGEQHRKWKQTLITGRRICTTCGSISTTQCIGRLGRAFSSQAVYQWKAMGPVSLQGVSPMQWWAVHYWKGNTQRNWTRIVIPKKLRPRVLSIAHEGHLGIVGTKQKLRSKLSMVVRHGESRRLTL